MGTHIPPKKAVGTHIPPKKSLYVLKFFFGNRNNPEIRKISITNFLTVHIHKEGLCPNFRPVFSTFVSPYITSTITIDNKQDATFLFIYFYSALRVSGDVFAHHEEHITVTTAWVELT